MRFEEIPSWFGKPFSLAEVEFLRKQAEEANRGMIDPNGSPSGRNRPAPVAKTAF